MACYNETPRPELVWEPQPTTLELMSLEELIELGELLDSIPLGGGE